MMLLLGFVLMCGAYLMPYHFHPWLSFQAEFLAASGALLVSAAAVGAAKGNRFLLTPASLVVMATAAVPIAQHFAGLIHFKSDTVLASMYLLGFGLAIATGATFGSYRRTEFLGGLFGALVAAGIVSTGLGLAQWLEVGPLPFAESIAPGGRPYANLLQPNHLATLIALSVVGALWLFETRRIDVMTLAIALGWFGLGLVMTRSRTGWLFVALLVIGWIAFSRRETTRTSLKGVALGVALFAVFTVAWSSMSSALEVGVPTSFSARTSDGMGRFRFGVLLLDALRSSPWFGFGWTQVSTAAYAGSLTHFTGEAMLRNSHNLFLDLLIWNGIPLGTLLIAASIWWVVSRVRNCRSTENWLLLSGTMAIAVHAMLEYPLEYAYFLLPMGFLVGIIDASTPERKVAVRPYWMALPLIALTGLLTFIASEYLKVEVAARQNALIMAGIGVDRVNSMTVPEVTLLDGPREYQRYLGTPATKGVSNADLDLMKKVVERNPSPPALLRYAIATGLNGRAQESSDVLRRLCNMHRRQRCDEGRVSWKELGKQRPELSLIDFPSGPS